MTIRRLVSRFCLLKHSLVVVGGSLAHTPKICELSLDMAHGSMQLGVDVNIKCPCEAFSGCKADLLQFHDVGYRSFGFSRMPIDAGNLTMYKLKLQSSLKAFIVIRRN